MDGGARVAYFMCTVLRGASCCKREECGKECWFRVSSAIVIYKSLQESNNLSCVIVDKKDVVQCAVRGCIPSKRGRREVCPFIDFQREEMLDNDG